MRNLKLATHISTILLLAIVVGGCSVVPSDNDMPATYAKSVRALEGEWELWMRLETSISSIIKGTLVVDKQDCFSAGRCEIGAKITISSNIEDTVYELRGYQYPDDDLVILKYDFINPFGDREESTLILDKFPGPPAPKCAMVGYYVTFANDAPGPPHGDSRILDTANRGQLSLAGRLTAVPANGLRNANCL